jgi:hypothetical protein
VLFHIKNRFPCVGKRHFERLGKKVSSDCGRDALRSCRFPTLVLPRSGAKGYLVLCQALSQPPLATYLR